MRNIKQKDELWYVDIPVSRAQVKFAELLARDRGYLNLAEYLEEMKWKKQRYLSRYDMINVIGSLKAVPRKPSF